MAEADPQIRQAGSTTRKDFDRERSKLLDAFARLEMAVSELLGCAGNAASFGQKLERLSTILEPSLFEQASRLNDARNDVVHSVLRMIPGSPAYAIYLNTTDTKSSLPRPLMLTIKQHQQFVRDCETLGNEVRKKLPQSNTLRD
jgi:hypothetical protein